MAFIVVRFAYSVLTLLSLFMKNGCKIFSKKFFIYRDDCMISIPQFFNMEYHMTDLQSIVLNLPCIPGKMYDLFNILLNLVSFYFH